MLPLLAGLGAIYAAGRLTTNALYWNDYKRNTGHFPKYWMLRGPGQSMGYGIAGLKSLKKL